MKIEALKMGSVDVIVPLGPLVDKDATEFGNILREKLHVTKPHVVVSLQHVPYMDSVALETLVLVSEDLAECAEELKLAQVPQICREVLELTGTTHYFRIFNEVEDAVKSYL